MVQKYGRTKGDYQLSENQLREKKEAERQADEVLKMQIEEARLAREAARIYNMLAYQHGPDGIYPGAYYRNGMGSHIQLVLSRGKLEVRFLSEEEKVGEFGSVWLPILPQGHIGDGDVGHKDPYYYEEVLSWGTALSDPIWLQDRHTGEHCVVQQERKMVVAGTTFGLSWEPQEEGFYDANRRCLAFQAGQMMVMPPGSFSNAVQIELNPNPAVDPGSGFDTDGFAQQALENNVALGAGGEETGISIPDFDFDLDFDWEDCDFRLAAASETVMPMEIEDIEGA